MIGRIWRGVVREQDKDTYFEYLQETGIKEYASVPGNRGVWVLRGQGGIHSADAVGVMGRDQSLRRT
jgi:hypothetical protein